ncbi:NfeD family protein [Sphingobium mellinum]|uniref:NfeD family protein n=1 Tax=Sphingobium mellinum TaxID=1387166 RepID=UPI0030EDE11A
MEEIMISSLLLADIIGTLLIVLGLVTLAGELFSPSHGALALGGMIGLFLGAAILNEPDLAANGVGPLLISTAILVFGLAILVAWAAAAIQRRRVVTGQEALIGAIGRVLSWDGGDGHIFVHGERWRASGGPVVANGSVRVVGIDGLTLAVEPTHAPGRSQDRRKS